MKIAYIHQHFGTRDEAKGTRSFEFARRLIARGHEVTMIAAGTNKGYRQGGNIWTESDVNGIRLFNCHIPYSTHLTIRERIQTFTRFGLEATKLIKSLDRFDLVFATSTPLTVAIPGILGARKHKVPFVLEVRDLWPELPKALGVKNPLLLFPMKRLELWSYKNAAHIIALAPGIRLGINKTGYPLDKIDLIPNSADIDVFTPSPTPNKSKSIRLAFTGAHGIANGLDAVIDAAEVVQKRGESGIEFCFIGSGKVKQHLIDRSKSLGLKNVAFLDPVPKRELASFLNTVDVGMMILKNVPAFYEGTSPNKFFDYLASGLPVLNNYPGWLKGIIEKEGCGIAVPPDDPEAFADAAVKFRDNVEMRLEMGRKARALGEREYSRDQLADQFIACLEAVYASRSRK